MNARGEVSVIKDGRAKVYIKELQFETGLLDIASHISDLRVNDKVVVAFYDNALTCGAIIVKV